MNRVPALASCLLAAGLLVSTPVRADDAGAQPQTPAGTEGATPGAALGPGMAKPPEPFKPGAADEAAQPDVWIFAGELQNSHETFSGTLVAGPKGDVQFELKLASGATCDSNRVSGDVGLVRLPEVTCSDDRVMRALFVPQEGKELKVFGHVADERFTASAHLLGTEPPPEPKQTAQPTVPGVQGRPPVSPPPAPAAPDGAQRP